MSNKTDYATIIFQSKLRTETYDFALIKDARNKVSRLLTGLRNVYNARCIFISPGSEWHLILPNSEKITIYLNIDQCENCDTNIDAGIIGPIRITDDEGREFCSDDCMLEDREERRIGLIEAREQYEMYGLDYDSWYR